MTPFGCELTHDVTLQWQLDKAEDVAATATRQLENQAKVAELERHGLQAEVLRASVARAFPSIAAASDGVRDAAVSFPLRLSLPC